MRKHTDEFLPRAPLVPHRFFLRVCACACAVADNLAAFRRSSSALPSVMGRLRACWNTEPRDWVIVDAVACTGRPEGLFSTDWHRSPERGTEVASGQNLLRPPRTPAGNSIPAGTTPGKSIDGTAASPPAPRGIDEPNRAVGLAMIDAVIAALVSRSSWASARDENLDWEWRTRFAARMCREVVALEASLLARDLRRAC